MVHGRHKVSDVCLTDSPIVAPESVPMEQVPSVNAAEVPLAAARPNTRSSSGFLPHPKRARSRSPLAGRSGGSGVECRDTFPNSNGSGGGRPFHWSYSHSWEFRVADYSEGLDHLFCHVKPAGCSIRAVKNLHLRKPYMKLTSVLGKLFEPWSSHVSRYSYAAEAESRLRAVHRKDKVDDMKKVLEEVLSKLDASRNENAKLAADLHTLAE
ncbi:hypothetical protein AALP_AAs74477U000100 [Arabis alpina]|uniref:Uncharacterized protein n=1 Tax=Arabis alpina TaxID=50452 RepID=A0A087FYK9_ARAAL|nr:hypothetical protein AALP_AAs74477U000100 [Arabis alpina]